MLNKNLEKKLKSLKLNRIITLLEKEEKGLIVILDMKVDKKMGITGNKSLDNELYKYLEEIGIKVIYTEHNKDLQPECKHFSHKIYNKKLSHENNVSNFLDNKIAMFKLDPKSKVSFAICPQCTMMITIA